MLLDYTPLIIYILAIGCYYYLRHYATLTPFAAHATTPLHAIMHYAMMPEGI